MSSSYFARYQSPNIVIVPIVILPNTNIIYDAAAAAIAANALSTTRKLADIKEISTDTKLGSNKEDVIISEGNIGCVDTSSHPANLQIIPVKSTVDENIHSTSKYSHNNLIDLLSYKCYINDTTSKLNSTSNKDNVKVNDNDTKPTEINAKVECGLISGTNKDDVTNKFKKTISTQIKAKRHCEEDRLKPNFYESQTDCDNIVPNNCVTSIAKHRTSGTQSKHSTYKNSQCPMNQGPIKRTYNRYGSIININKDDIKYQESKIYLEQNKLNRDYITGLSSNAQNFAKYKYENTLPRTNNEFLESNLSPRSLKRYIDYQSFIRKYYNNTYTMQKMDKDKEKKPCNNMKVSKTSEKRANNNSLNHKDKVKQVNVKSASTIEQNKKVSKEQANMEQNKKREEISNIEQTKKKDELKRKSNGDKDKNKSNERSVSADEQKKRKGVNKEKEKLANLKTIKMKDEFKTKLANNVAFTKKGIDERNSLNLNTHKRETDKNSQCSDQDKNKNLVNNKIIDHRKHKLHKVESNKKSSSHSRKQIVQETSKNYSKTVGVKRKMSESEEGVVKKTRKLENNIQIPSIKTVNVTKKVHKYANAQPDGRQKLTDKKCTTHDVHPTTSKSVKEHVLRKPKVKKSKTVKVVINITCQNSQSSSENTNKRSSSPHLDLSFLDDLDIDGIVDILNSGKSPIREHHIVENNIMGVNICNKHCNIRKEKPLKKNCEVQHQSANICAKNCNAKTAEPLKNGELTVHHKQNFVNKSEDSKEGLLDSPNQNITEPFNDDVYEVIDITDESENNIIVLEDIIQSPNNITKDMSVIYINDDSQDEVQFRGETHNIVSKNVMTIKNEAQRATSELPNAVELKSTIQNICTIDDSKIKIEPKKITNICGNSSDVIIKSEKKTKDMGDALTSSSNTKVDKNNTTGILQVTALKTELMVKSENNEQKQNNITPSLIAEIQSDSNEAHVNNNENNTSTNIKKETDSIPKNIKKESTDHSSFINKHHVNNGVLHPSTNIKKEPNNTNINTSAHIKKEQNNTNINTSTLIKKELTVNSSFSNIQQHINNGVNNTSTDKKNEPINTIAHTTNFATSKNSSILVPVNNETVIANPETDKIKENTTIASTDKDVAVPCSTLCAYDGNLNNQGHDVDETMSKSITDKNSERSEKYDSRNVKKQTCNDVVVTSISKNMNNNSDGGNLKSNVINNKVDMSKKNVAKVLKMKIPKKKISKTADVEGQMSAKTLGKIPSQSNVTYWKVLEKRMSEYLHKSYSITQFIHNGYYSTIYKCTDSCGQDYAIKISKSGFQSKSIYKDKMLSSLQKSSDTNFLLRMINSFSINGGWCFLSEYYPKTVASALQQTKKNKKCFHIDLVQTLSRQLVAAVCVLTQNQLIHADIKPAHIILNSTHDKLKLCGFDKMDYNYNIKIIPSTGTSSYRAPEVILGYHADYKIDVWATALVMFEMATGKPLFPGHYNNDILYKQMCTLGPIENEMIEASSQSFVHFYDTKFMRQSGPEDWSFVDIIKKNQKLRNDPLTSYNIIWAPSRSQLQITEDLDKLEMFTKLLGQMLTMHPRNRLPITYVAADEFIYHSDMS